MKPISELKRKKIVRYQHQNSNQTIQEIASRFKVSPASIRRVLAKHAFDISIEGIAPRLLVEINALEDAVRVQVVTPDSMVLVQSVITCRAMMEHMNLVKKG